MKVTNEDEVYKFYNETFKYLYADLVATIGEKSEQVSFELQACLSHLVVAKTTTCLETATKNYDKAHGHLVRASLDCAKLIWIELRRRAKDFSSDADLMQLGHNSTMDGCYKLLKESEEFAKKARRAEVTNTGVNPEDTIILWYQSIEALNKFLDLFVASKVSSIKKVRKTKTFKDRLWDILVAFVIGMIVTLLAGYASGSFELKKPDFLVNFLYSQTTVQK